MMVAATNRARIDLLALVAGVGLAALAVVGWRVEGGTTPSPAEVAVLVAPSQDLAVATVSGSDEATKLQGSTSGEGIERRLAVRNATGSRLNVRIQADASSRELDGALRLRVRTDGQTLFEGELGALRSGGPAFPLESHQTADVEVLAWIPLEADGHTWGARAEQIQIHFVTTPTGQ
jgi:hypothetical protein